MSSLAPLEQGIDAFLAEYEKRELVRVLTAGSVDDGKSTLIGRLLYDTRAVYEDQLAAVKRDSEHRGAAGGALDLALLTDGLRAEREQGITIDVAYRYFSTAHRKFILADCPGHEQYTRNMATGASNCDLAILLVDARQGVLRQTRRHAFIASLLGIRHMVVAVNKMDLVDWDEAVFERIRADFTDFATRLAVPDVRFIPISALGGDNVVTPSRNMPWYGGETLLHVLETVHIASDRNLVDLRLPVQYVNRAHADFRGLSGTVASGIIRPGDDLLVLPAGVRCQVDQVLDAGAPIAEGFPPMAVAVTLTEDVDVTRGDMLVHPGNQPRVDRTFDAMIVWMAEEPLTPGRQYFLKHTTRLVSGQVSTLHYRIDVNTLHREQAGALAMNEVGRCTVVVNRPLVFDAYRQNRTTGAFIIIDRLTNGTVGAGMILDRQPDPAGQPWLEPLADASRTTGPVTADERAARLGHDPALVLIDLAGKGEPSATASRLERHLFDCGRAVAIVDPRGVDAAAAVRALLDAGLIVLAVETGTAPAAVRTAAGDRRVVTLSLDGTDTAAAIAQLDAELAAAGVVR